MQIELLGEIGGPNVIRTLEHVLFYFYDWPYHCAAARALGEIGGKEAIEVLEKSKKVLGGWALDEVVEVLQRLKQTGKG